MAIVRHLDQRNAVDPSSRCYVVKVVMFKGPVLEGVSSLVSRLFSFASSSQADIIVVENDVQLQKFLQVSGMGGELCYVSGSTFPVHTSVCLSCRSGTDCLG